MKIAGVNYVENGNKIYKNCGLKKDNKLSSFNFIKCRDVEEEC